MSDSDRDSQEELKRAQVLASDGMLGEALILLRSIVRREPQLAKAHYLMAALLMEQEAYDEASEAAERCLELEPGHDRAEKVRDTCRQALEAQTGAERTATYRPATFVYEETRKIKVPKRPCPSCGKEIARGARLCRHCGAYVGAPPWLRTISLWLLGACVVVAGLYFLFSIVGRRSLEPVSIRGDGSVAESAADDDVAVRIDRLKWHPGFIIPMPIPADSGDQVWAMSHKATCRGVVSNASDEPLAYVVVQADFSGRTGIHFGSAYAEVIGIPPGESKEFSIGTRLGNRASHCKISVGEFEFGELEPQFTLVPAAKPSKGRLFVLIRFIILSAVSSLLLFVAARLQLACDAKIPWDYELRADAVAAVVMVPIIAILNFMLLFLRYGSFLGPLGLVALLGPVVLFVLAVVYLFKRGVWGFFGILFFFICLNWFFFGWVG